MKNIGIIEKLISSSNPQQLSAIIHDHNKSGPLLILAGAGSGKTTVLTKRIIYLLLKGIEQKSILALTFTRKAATEMNERISSSLFEYGLSNDINSNDCEVSTFHALALKILKGKIVSEPNFKYAGFTEFPKIIGEEDSRNILAEILNSQPNKSLLGTNETLEWIEKNSSFYGTPNEFRNSKYKELDSNETLLLKNWEEFQNIKKKTNCLDLNDLISIASYILEGNPELLKYYRNLYSYIHIDEYQDTNGPQYKFSKLICGKNSNLFIVGDDDQSIYGFRGADISNIMNFNKDYPNSTIIKLETNYRSIPNVMKLANNIFKSKPSHLKKTLRPNLENRDDLFKENAKIRVCRGVHERDEFNFIAEEIKQLVLSAKYKYSDIAILYRNNYQGSRLLEVMPNEYEIPIYDENKDGIKLNTIHASKGLEYPVVFYSGLCEKISPTYPFSKCSKEDFKKAIEEEKRLFYVGVTRAKYRLYLSYSLEYTWYGKKRKFKSSRFLKLVPGSIKWRQPIKEHIKAFLLKP